MKINAFFSGLGINRKVNTVTSQLSVKYIKEKRQNFFLGEPVHNPISVSETKEYDTFPQSSNCGRNRAMEL